MKLILRIDQIKLRGISRNKIGAAVATNKSKSIIISTGVSKPSLRSTEKAYLSHIAPGSKIIRDMEKSHNILVSKLNLESIAYNSSQLKGLPDNKNPLYPVNRLHFLLQSFMNLKYGYSRENLQDWLNLFWFIVNGPTDKYDKVAYFIELALEKRTKLLRYRHTMRK